MKIPVSILVMTLNEERDLETCLDRLTWSDDIVILDSESSDRTVEVARRFGCRVVRKKLITWAEHQNWAVKSITFHYPWVLNIDADEIVTKELAANVAAAVANPGEHVGFRVLRRDHLKGRWLKHVQATTYYLRLFMPGHIRFERLVNPVSIADGPVGKIGGFLDHYPFSKGYFHWLERHNSYSTLEAAQIIVNRGQKNKVSIKKALFGKDIGERKSNQKELFGKLPARPLAKFILLYILKRGFLDGGPGFTYAVLQAFYEYMIHLKCCEQSFRKSDLFTHELTGETEGRTLWEPPYGSSSSSASRSAER
jgi:glycosyltransferase involved in cell wall biosynthesis